MAGGRDTEGLGASELVLVGGALVVAVALVYRVSGWPYALAALVAGVLGGAAWFVVRADRHVRAADHEWRAEDAVAAGRRTLDELDAMTGTQFEEHVAALCRRDGCTEVRRVGGAGDNGADVRGRMPDGRTMVVQCKRYAPKAAIPARDMRELRGAQAHFKADVAILVTTSRFTRQSTAFAVENGIIAIHRDFLGLWNNGTRLPVLAALNGAGQGDRRHRERWKRTYDDR
ncbi:restriction endonuclease [Streptomycetaceae bacterium NBC_01309]